ncbi:MULTISPECIES: ABC transporter ATP-binding protein [unclassified Treponema]|uniref:ABC transporter ATP-binding protein n=1 Tax=unclassified Treponema TaxID=2638727 RepID=UPI0020A33F75|nr:MULTISPECIES: oligopeptide/dipeptide ABC transporter ATP-binding protein [unclassified Treponema]UTC66208.1 ATP-binding cassette domain-containing protein [Treponema sp. OMZ 789]UTC68937.1 ATP-binding cassette domain-containing protein [Treponema sp. OMZ 790]UTC71665.1 ATP-binding cassette domain-containing protein [Treponema sp. OMZ 791]
MAERQPIFEAVDLVQEFSQGKYTKNVVHALNGVNIKVYQGETLGLVGETGCGKSTLCRAMMRLYKPTSGKVLYKGRSIESLPERKLRDVRRNVQMIFQDPADSMNSRMNVGYIIEEPLLIQTKMSPNERKDKVMGLLKYVGLPEDAYYRYPHEFSGGQRQRIAIARALVLDPEVVVCDEPVSALDVSVQSQVLNLLLDMQKERNLTLLFISHGLNVVKHMSDRVAVMYLGSIMEMAPSVDIYKEPLHPYTQALIAAIPDTDPDNRRRRIPFTGEIPSPINLPTGCPFHLNCSKKIDKCSVEKPVLREVADGHMCACHLV